MRNDRFMQLAMEGYAAALEADNASPYVCLRFFQNYYRYRGEGAEELLRRAVLELVAHDPLLLVTDPHGSRIRGLKEDDIQECIRSWALDDDHLQAFLEGHLRMASVASREPDLAMVRRALAAFDRAGPALAEDHAFLELYVEALRMLGDDRYPEKFDELLGTIEPEWHARELHRAMRHAVEQQDWDRYDMLRGRWAGLPRNAHVCECYINQVANIDGLRALSRGDHEEVLRLLRAAVEVGGCPHLNTGAASLRLARELLDRKLAVEQVKEHLEAVEQYCPTDEVAELIRQAGERRTG